MTQNANQLPAANQPTSKDEKISPLIEMTLVLLVKIAEYLKVYARDVKVQDSRYYKEAQKSLKDAVTNLSKLLGLGPEFFAHVFSDKSLTDLIAPKAGATSTTTTPQVTKPQTVSAQETTTPQPPQTTDTTTSQPHNNTTTFTTELLPPSENLSSLDQNTQTTTDNTQLEADIAMTDEPSQDLPSQNIPAETTQQTGQASQPADNTNQGTPSDQTAQNTPNTQDTQDDDISKLLEQLDQLAKKEE